MTRQYSGFWFVNVYSMDREFGGPEEGGWWYDTGRFLKSRPCRTRREAHKLVDRWNRYLDAVYNNPRGCRADLSSVCCEGRLGAQIQRKPGFDFPEVRPHYE